MLNIRFALLFVCIACILVAFTKAKVDIISREQWGSKKIKTELPKLELPVRRVIIMHTEIVECSNYQACATKVQVIQRSQMANLKYADITYNFLIDNEGYIYEGRGWDQEGDIATHFNADSLGIAFIGNYDKIEPSKEALEALQSLLKMGVRMGKIAHKYRLLGHCQIFETDSPGNKLYSIIKKWPHWSLTA